MMTNNITARDVALLQKLRASNNWTLAQIENLTHMFDLMLHEGEVIEWVLSKDQGYREKLLGELALSMPAGSYHYQADASPLARVAMGCV